MLTGKRSFSHFLFHCRKMGKWINGSDLDSAPMGWGGWRSSVHSFHS